MTAVIDTGSAASARPAYHFTPEAGWMNDPNGLIYYQNEYHLFYQSNPNELVWGPMHWGHAVSTDLLRWTHLPLALAPDSLGTIFSGSVVADIANTSGLVPGGGLIAVFSYDTQAQGIASSADNGRTWTKYAGNPVIASPSHDFRDPQVFWHEPVGAWVMVIAAHDHVEFYMSPNLINWTQSGTFGAGYGAHGGVWECPDLFPLDSGGMTKWVLIVSVGGGSPAGGSGTQYFIGSFDGKTFQAENPPNSTLWLDHGPDNYAGVTYNGLPDGRRILVGWMNNTRYANAIPAGTWRGMMTIPRELELIHVAGHGLRLSQFPVSELDPQRARLFSERDVTLNDSSAALPPTEHRALDILIEFDRFDAADFGLRICQPDGSYTAIGIDRHARILCLDRTHAGNTSFHEAFPAIVRAPLLGTGKLALRILVDRTSVEVFADGGATVVTALVFPTPGDPQIELYAVGGSATVSRLDVARL